MTKVALDLHDFSISNNRMELMFKLKEHFPNLKVSVFIVPFEKKLDWGPTLIHDDNLRLIKENLDWIQLVPHGFSHESSREMENVGYNQFKDILKNIESIFQKEELPFEKGFCAPHWRWNKHVVNVLDEFQWWGAVLREDKMLKTKRFYKYNFLLNEPFWESNEPILKLHGHIYGTKNDIGRCFENLLK